MAHLCDAPTLRVPRGAISTAASAAADEPEAAACAAPQPPATSSSCPSATSSTSARDLGARRGCAAEAGCAQNPPTPPPPSPAAPASKTVVELHILLRDTAREMRCTGAVGTVECRVDQPLGDGAAAAADA
eukprot:CAMPEP_0181215200 /NCGR_PEP_ID=MMETSP1096-20121128/25882_1 /TAXON_ID=156174 ORGANISM="Chrysochromulina ericina, Strain CCMP281" /NCGR_SAMPLE_ID=MMETSP1096 /ASSEMBLY_ACC=CAM_ASM_000453 /LENGTH=130 /DNA_ID=CAMNT_0023307031 /DNA_START=262 /DNA_END=652 /DNA_ORIENTATION=-